MGNDVSEVAAAGAERPDEPEHAPSRRRLWWGKVLAFAVIASALVLAAVFASTSGLRKDEIVEQAATLGSLAPQSSVAPGPPPSFKGVRFPDLSRAGWLPADARRDVVADRVALTVFYASAADGRRLAVTILFGQALPPPPGSRLVTSNGVVIARMVRDDRAIVAWRRRGRTTIMSVASAESADLVRLVRLATPQPRSSP